MIPRNLDSDTRRGSLVWEDLTNGVPTIVALAKLCSEIMARPVSPSADLDSLSDEAQTILAAAAETGAISIRGDKNAFEPGERFLAICVERAEGQRVDFRCVGNPEQTIRFVDGFRQLCSHGLVMHQLMNDFSLTTSGFAAAAIVDSDQIERLIQLGREVV